MRENRGKTSEKQGKDFSYFFLQGPSVCGGMWARSERDRDFY